jgi:hypothetical protein
MNAATKRQKTLSFICDLCGKHYENKPPYNAYSDITPGYGKTKDDKICCYPCCAEEDKRIMRETGRRVLYLTSANGGGYRITNWPGSLEFSTTYASKGGHNIAGVRRDVWFKFEGKLWHGVQYGNTSQLCYCKVTKQK